MKLTYAARLCAGGMAYYGRPYRKTLIGKPTTSNDKRTLKCPVGWIEMHLPRALVLPHWQRNPECFPTMLDAQANALKAAEHFVDLAIHETAHIRQYRAGRWTHEFYGRRAGGKRIRHDDRPCEVDAEMAIVAVKNNRAQDKRRQELAVRLALALLG